MKRIITLSMFVAVMLNVVRAGNGGSGYSRFGIGDIQYFVSSRALGMGGAGLAVLSTNSINRMNPAAWVNINRTRFSVSTLYEGYSTMDSTHSAFYSAMNFNGAAIALPISTPSGIVLTLGVTPYSVVNYFISAKTSQTAVPFSLSYHGDGVLSTAHIGLSASANSNFHLGAKLNYYFGTLRHSVSQNFDDISQYAKAEDLRSVQLSGIGFTFGAIYSGFNSLLHLDESQSLNIGLVINTTSYLSSTEENLLTYSTSSLTTRETTMTDKGKIRLPLSVGVGISYLSNRVLLASDLYLQQWSTFDGRGLLLPTNRDGYRFGAGAEFLPSRDASASFSEHLGYRAGFFYNATYYQIKNEPINEVGITGGLGVPMFGDTRLNINASYSVRGTTSQQLQKDNIFRISFTLSGGEMWFVQPPQD